MSKSTLRFLAVLLTCLIFVVLFAGLDNLPRSLRAQIASERQSLDQASKQVQAARDEVSRDLASEPALFVVRSMSTVFPQRLDRAQASIQDAGRDMATLTRLEKANRRTDRERVESLLRHERSLRTSAVTEATSIESEARRWIERKRNLPKQAAEMEREYQVVRGLDVAPLAATVQKAETDWPDKRTDLESRLAGVRAIATQADQAWQSSASLRRQAAANEPLDYAAFFTAADVLDTAAADLPKKSGELQALAGQLYWSWDKLLVDMEVRGSGRSRRYDQKIRTVKTHIVDVSANKGETTSDEKWVDVSPAAYQSMEDKLGMAVEHKAAGRYDSEAERVAQPAGFAYMASLSQGRNQYGYWEHRDGGNFWVWYGQYALLRDLLWGRSYRPLPSGEYENYRSYQSRGQTYYGRDESSRAPRYGTGGVETQRRYSDSTYARGGGFSDSKYATRSGGYRDSKYATPAGRQPGGDTSGRSFGRSSGSSPRASPAPSSRPSYRPSSPPSRPSFGGGRRFGGGGRRR